MSVYLSVKCLTSDHRSKQTYWVMSVPSKGVWESEDASDETVRGQE